MMILWVRNFNFPHILWRNLHVIEVHDIFWVWDELGTERMMRINEATPLQSKGSREQSRLTRQSQQSTSGQMRLASVLLLVPSVSSTPLQGEVWYGVAVPSVFLPVSLGESLGASHIRTGVCLSSPPKIKGKWNSIAQKTFCGRLLMF